MSELFLMPSRLLARLLVAAGLCLTATLAGAASGDRLDRSRLQPTFADEFAGELSWCSERCAGQTWRTKAFHSGDTPMARGVGLGSDSELATDRQYLGLGIDPFEVRDGILTVKVRPADERTREAVRKAWPPWYSGERAVPRFTSGMLSTERSFTQLYGYFEARVKVPKLVAGWPAFWLLSEAQAAGQEAGLHDEIDVFEILTGRTTKMYFGHQWGQGDQSAKKAARSERETADLSADFHVHGVLWTKDEIVYYLDEREIGRFANVGLSRPMYMIVSIGMDGDWNRKEGFLSDPRGAGDLLVDYVRAYSLR